MLTNAIEKSKLLMVKSKINIPDLKDFLDEKSYQYESLEFIKDDPILIPHSFNKKHDIEISGFISLIFLIRSSVLSLVIPLLIIFKISVDPCCKGISR